MNRRAFLLASTGCWVAANDARNAVVMVPKKHGMSDIFPTYTYLTAMRFQMASPSILRWSVNEDHKKW